MAKILIVDDELSVRLLLQATLPVLGYEVAGVAADGAEALELARFLKPDLVLMDIVMPGAMDGVEAAKKIRSELAIPVIFLSGHDADEIVNRAKCADPFAFLIKPCSESELKAAIELALHHGKKERRVNEVLSSYREFAEAVPQTLWLRTGDYGRILYLSSSYEKMWGRSREALLKDPLDHLAAVHPDELPYVLEKIERQKAGEITEKVFRIVLPDGSLRWLKDCAFPIKEDDGNISRIAGISEDITEQMRREQALQASEERYRRIVETAEEGIWLVDREWKTSFVNVRMEQMLGCRPGEMLGRHLLEFMDEEGALAAREYMGRREDGVREGHEFSFVRKDGTELWALVSASPLPDESGAFSGALAMVTDITERKRAEEALRVSEERLRLAHKATNDVIWDWDVVQNAQHWNETGGAVFGWTDIVESPQTAAWWVDRVHPEDRQRVQDGFFAAVNDPGADRWHDEYRFRKADGAYAEVIDRGYVLRDEQGKATRMIGAMLDITERKQAAEERRRFETHLRQAQKMEAIGTLAGGIAHDFNNVLSAIIGFTELSFGKAPQGSPLQADLQQVLLAADRAKDLVKQILTFSRQSEQVARPVQILPLLKEALKFLRASIPSTIAIRQHLKTSSESTVLADPTQIHQVIMNLCTNASYAMRERGGTLEVELSEVVISENDDPSAYPGMAPGNYLRLRVSDTGCGVDEETLQRIFDPFFTTKPREEGTGMGLAVVYGIVEACGGGITVRSKPGEGSHFYLYFPKAPSLIPKRLSDQKEVPRGKGLILFVDDEAALVRLGEKMLQSLGYTVVAESSSVQALALFRSKPDEFDLLITDYTMPQMTGLDLIKQIRQIRADLPVILCSGHTDFLDSMSISDLGVQELIRKPINRRTMAEAVSRFLPRK